MHFYSSAAKVKAMSYVIRVKKRQSHFIALSHPVCGDRLPACTPVTVASATQLCRTDRGHPKTNSNVREILQRTPHVESIIAGGRQSGACAAERAAARWCRMGLALADMRRTAMTSRSVARADYDTL